MMKHAPILSILVFLLSACGGGGGGSPAQIEGSAPGETAPPPGQETGSGPGPGAAPANPGSRQNQLPQAQKSPLRALLTSTVTDLSTIPFPSGTPVTDQMTNMNAFGKWGHPNYQPGGSRADDNEGPNVAVRRRVGYSKKCLCFTIGETNYWYGTAAIADLWLTYPADAGASDLAVHIRTRRATPGGRGSISDDVHKEIDSGSANTPISDATGIVPLIPEDNDARQTQHKSWVGRWLKAAAGSGVAVQDFFLTEAYLQAPGSAVQPVVQAAEMSATWTGKAIAFDSAAGSTMFRGTEIGGDAEITVNFGTNPTVDVSLTNLRSARSVDFQTALPSMYPSQSWTGLALSGGEFSDSSGGRTIEGTFRNQGTTAGTNANTVGGIFDVTGTMKGGFVATFGN